MSFEHSRVIGYHRFEILIGFHKGEQYSRRLRTIDLYNVSITSVLLVWNTLKTHAAIRRALSVIVLIWGDQDRLWETMTPRSRSWITGVRVFPWDVVYWNCSQMKGNSLRGLSLLALWQMYSNLSSCKVILFVSYHWITCSRSLWRVLTSSSPLIF